MAFEIRTETETCEDGRVITSYFFGPVRRRLGRQERRDAFKGCLDTLKANHPNWKEGTISACGWGYTFDPTPLPACTC